MAEPIEHASVRITPDFSGFKTKLKAELRKATAGTKVTVTVTPKMLAKDLTAAAKDLAGKATVTVKASVDVASLKDSAKKAGAKTTVKVKAEPYAEHFRRSLAKVARTTVVKVKVEAADRAAVLTSTSGSGGGGRRGGRAAAARPPLRVPEAEASVRRDYINVLRDSVRRTFARTGTGTDIDDDFGDALTEALVRTMGRVKPESGQFNKLFNRHVESMFGSLAADDDLIDRTFTANLADEVRRALSRVRPGEEITRVAETAYAEEHKRRLTRVRNEAEALERIQLAAIAEDKKRSERLAQAHHRAYLAAEREARRAEREALRVEREALRGGGGGRGGGFVDTARRFVSGAGVTPTLIDFGAVGIRPTNLFIAAVVAATPALAAMAASAGYASTSVVALGAAAIGTGTAIAALMTGFTGVAAALKAHEAATKAEVRQAAQSQSQQMARAKAVTSAQRAIADAMRGVQDAKRDYVDAQVRVAQAQLDLNQAWRDAARDLRDLRELVSDLALQEEGATLALRRARLDLDDTRRSGTDAVLERRKAELALRQAQERQVEVNRDAEASELDRADAALRVQDAQQNLDEVNRRARRHTLDLAEANLSVRQAEDRLSDVRRDRADRTRELNQIEREGLHSTERVADAVRARTAAQRAAYDAERRVADARRQVVEATENLAMAQAQHAERMTRASAAAQDLQEALAKLSPTGRRLYDQLVSMQPAWEAFRRRVEAAMLPGFITFLRDVSAAGRDGRATLDLVSKSVTDMGRVISATVARFGKLTRTEWFRGTFTRISAENVAAFTAFGQAAADMIRPIMRLTAAAAPQLTRFADYLDRQASRFDAWVASFTDADLAGYFKGAGDELAKWWDLITNIGQIVIDVLRASLPTGENLVTRLRDFTDQVQRWTGSDEGQRRMAAFFKIFQDVDYGKLFKTVGQIITLYATFRTIKFVAKNPVFTLLGLLAAEYPKETGEVLQSAATAIGGIARWVNRYPNEIATALAVFAAVKGLAAVGAIDIGRILGGGKGGALGGFADRLRGDMKTATMTVQAGVVNVFGAGAGAPGRRGAPPVIVPPGGGGGGKPGGGKLGWLGRAGSFGARLLGPIGWAVTAYTVLDLIETMLPKQAQGSLTGGPQINQAANVAGYIANAVKLPSVAKWLEGFKGKDFAESIMSVFDSKNWSDMSEAWGEDLRAWGERIADLAEDPGGPLRRLRERMPRALGSAIVGGLRQGMIDRFAGLAPSFTAIGSAVLDKIGAALTPSGVAPRGAGALDGLRQGMIDRFAVLADAIVAIGSAIVVKVTAPFAAPLVTPHGRSLIASLYAGAAAGLGALTRAFTAVGTRIVAALTSAFGSIPTRLAVPVAAAKIWLDRNLIVPVNHLLSTINVTPLPFLAASSGNATKVWRNVTPPATGAGNQGFAAANRMASGGKVPGRSPHPRADNIPILATANEYVMPVDAVSHYGVDMMEAIRAKRLPRFASGGMVWQRMWNWVSSRFPQATLNSAYYDRLRDGWGFHPAGKAIDIGAPGVYQGTGVARDIFNAIKGTFFRNIDELIWDFAGNKAVWQGREHFFTGPSAGPGTHADHIHWAMSDFAAGPGGTLLGGAGAVPVKALATLAQRALDRARGVFPRGLHGDLLLGAMRNVPSQLGRYAVDRIAKFDSGGTWWPGTLGVNGTGRPETVRTADQEAALWSRPIRLDGRDLQALANMIVAASGRPIAIDGHRVSEALSKHSYVPAGV